MLLQRLFLLVIAGGTGHFISPRRETHLGWIAYLYGQKHFRDEAI